MMENFVVYTVFTGNIHNELNDPFPEGANGFDRICFTSDMTIEPKSWKLVHFEAGFLEAARASRLPKILPHRYLPGYRWSLYIDTTIRFKRSPVQLFQKYASDENKYWCVPHPWRNCIYREAEEIIRLGYDDERRVREQIDCYRQAGYPDNAGLMANGVLLREHTQPDIIQFNEVWFWHILRYSKRDQLSFPFLASKLQLNYSLFELNLHDNDFWVWPGFLEPKLPGDFDENIYTWLNPAVGELHETPAKHYLTIGAAKSLPYTTRKWELTWLANKYRSGRGSYYFNKHNYTSVYEQLFQHLRDKPLRILVLGLAESGVRSENLNSPYTQAPCLQMWREYFPNAKIIGFDSRDFSAVPPIPNVVIVQGDIEKKMGLLAVVQDGNFDIIIDGANSASRHQEVALSALYPYLSEGGFYIIEDIDVQPAQLEKQDALKTKLLIKLVKLGIFVHNPYISRVTLAEIYASGILQFYDSFDINFERTSDSLVVIQKKIQPFPGRSRLWHRLRLYMYLVRSHVIKRLIDWQKSL